MLSRETHLTGSKATRDLSALSLGEWSWLGAPRERKAALALSEEAPPDPNFVGSGGSVGSCGYFFVTVTVTVAVAEPPLPSLIV
jgi:hypothetical protein